MAAYAALVSLMNVLDNIQNHCRLSSTLDKNQIKSLSEKIDCLLDFIENDCHGVISKETQDLERQITSAAHAAEDVIESHVVDQIHSGSVSLLDLHTILQDVDQVKEMVVNFKDRETEVKDVQANYPISATWSTPLTSSRKSKMVGFDEELIQILDALTGRQSSLQIIPFVGMGGSGKTTLATNVYEHRLISHHFDIRAWVTISQNYSVREIFLKLLSCQSFSTTAGGSETEAQLGLKLHQSLIRRRYLIILDDIWSIEVWEKIMLFFPDNNNGSRIVVTTRLSNLALHFGSNNLLSMKFLGEDKSWNLFCESAFAQEGCCPPELEEVGRKIVGKCKGLPLMIVVIGGLLRKSSMTQGHWKNISKDINLILDNLGAEDEKSLDVLSLSYIHLPAHLKPCFLYMGIFPEDQEIDVSELIKLWVAEGFLKPNKTQSLEEVSKCYLKDLVDRNLILVRHLSVHGEVESYGMHDLLRDLCLKTCEKEKFMCVVRVSDDDIRGGIDYKVHRIVLHGRIRKKKHEHLVLFRALESASLTRSLVGNNSGELSSKFKLLRVSNMINSSSDDIFMQVNLRYISMTHSWVNAFIKFPSTISLLWNLQTLVCNCDEAVAPPEIWEMRQLRHVKFSKIYLPDPPLSDKQDESVVLWNLQTLEGVTDLTLSDEVCKRIPNINQLAIIYNLSKYHDLYLYNVGRFLKLDSLHFKSGIDGIDQEVHLVQNMAFLMSLRILRLDYLSLGSEDLEIIGTLPALVSLVLIEVTFSGNEWRGKFLALKRLTILCCDGLTQWKDDSDLPVLEMLYLSRASELDDLPLAIGENTLRYIRMSNCSLSANISAAKILEDRMSLGNDNDLVVQIEFDFTEEKDIFLQEIREFECLRSDKLIIHYIDDQDGQVVRVCGVNGPEFESPYQRSLDQIRHTWLVKCSFVRKKNKSYLQTPIEYNAAFAYTPKGTPKLSFQTT